MLAESAGVIVPSSKATRRHHGITYFPCSSRFFFPPPKTFFCWELNDEQVLTESAGVIVPSSSAGGMGGNNTIGSVGNGIVCGGGGGVGGGVNGSVSPGGSKRGRPCSTSKKSRLKDLLRRGYRCLALLEEVGPQRLLEASAGVLTAGMGAGRRDREPMGGGGDMGKAKKKGGEAGGLTWRDGKLVLGEEIRKRLLKVDPFHDVSPGFVAEGGGAMVILFWLRLRLRLGFRL